MEPPIPAAYAENLKCPLISSLTTYQQARVALGLSSEAADILDDVRFLTMSLVSPDLIPSSTSKIRSTAAWFHKKLQGLATVPQDDIILDIIRMSALVYSDCITSLKPFKNIYTDAELVNLLDKISAVGLARWKLIPGIFLWVLLLVCPSSGNDLKGRFLRKKMAVTGMSIGMEDFGLAIACLRAFWKVQRWIQREMVKAV